jgi:hypothetical protein
MLFANQKSKTNCGKPETLEDIPTFRIFWGASLVATCETIEQTLRYSAKFRHRFLTIYDDHTLVTEAELRERAICQLKADGTQVWPANSDAPSAGQQTPLVLQPAMMCGAR